MCEEQLNLEEQPRREICQEQLDRILADHQRWLESKGKEGKRANLASTDLSGFNIFQQNLSGANLYRAKLHRILGTKFHDADLREADLTAVKGLLVGQLSGADLSGATLPRAISKFDGLANVEETCRNARKLFISLVLGCIYSGLTIATTLDARLITNSVSSPLPILGSEIPIVSFYWAGPIILLGLYFYLHIYLQRLWESLVTLPAIFPDGEPLDKKAYPWFLVGLIYGHLKILKGNRPALSYIQMGLSILFAWCIVPVTVLFFWGRYLRRHEWGGTVFLTLMLVGSIVVGVFLYRLAQATLRRERKPFLLKKAFRDPRVYKYVASTLGLFIIFTLLSFGAINGVPPLFYEGGRRPDSPAPDLNATDIRRFVPRLFEVFFYSPFANLEDSDVSFRPPNWTGQEISSVRGARLKGKNLRYANLNGAFLVKSDLNGADFYAAFLHDADLRGVYNYRAWGTDGTNFEGCSMSGADLREAKFGTVNFRGAILIDADLRGVVIFSPSDFKKATLVDADLRDAKFRFADFRGAHLMRADLRGAVFRGVFLNLANQIDEDKSTNFRGADLTGADLRGTDLVAAIGLTRTQIEAAIIDDSTKLPDYLQLSTRGHSRGQ